MDGNIPQAAPAADMTPQPEGKRPVYSAGTIEAIANLANKEDQGGKKPGYRKITKALREQGWKVSVTGARDVCARQKKDDGDASKVIRKKKGSGRKFSVEKVRKGRGAHEASNDPSLREIAKSAGLKKSTVERIRKTAPKK